MDLKYSIDMVTLDCRIDKQLLKFIEHKYLQFSPGVDYWIGSSFKGFRHNWRVTEMGKGFPANSYSYYLGAELNSEIKTTKLRFRLEFNPNKCDLSGLLGILLFTYFLHKDTILKYVDVAVDIPVNILSIYYDSSSKKVEKIFNYGGDDKTIYLGSGNNRIKIYNKAKELNLNGVDLTRYEISLKVNQSLSVLDPGILSYNLVDLFIIDNYPTGDLTLDALIYAVIKGYPIKKLSRRYKELISNTLTKLNIEKDLINETIVNFVKKIFDLRGVLDV